MDHLTPPLRFYAPAKLNLFLHITGRREDGYHNLQTVFQFLNYGDELSFTVRKDTSAIQLQPFFSDIPIEQNLVVRAAHLLQTISGTRLGVDIHLHKRLPLGGGLGGGSSNAATTLVALNQLWHLGLSKTELQQLGLSLGADVPIFIYGESAFAEGVGEKFQSLTLKEPWYSVIIPNCSVNTTKIFSDKQLTRNTPTITITDFLQGQGHNDFEPVVRRNYPEVADALDWLAQFAEARVTGSGCCIFAACENEQHAQAIIQHLPAPLRGFVAKGCNMSPLYQQHQ